MTRQEAYDKIRAYFSRPEAQLAFSKRDAICRYRMKKNGRIAKCAFGCLIPDKLYDRHMENNDAVSVIEDFPALREFLGITGMAVYSDPLARFIAEAQTAHDNSKTVEEFLNKLDRKARQVRLVVPSNV